MTSENRTAASHGQPHTQIPNEIFDISHWQPIDQFLVANPQFQIGQLRWLLREKEINGIDKCVKKVGRRYYIHDQLFAKWILNRG